MTTTGTIGPHEDLEHEFLLNGSKHVAYFGEIIPDACIPLFGMPEFAVRQWETDANGEYFTSFILYRKGHEDAAERLEHLVRTTHDFIPDIEREIGRILGYSEADIEAWIARITSSFGQRKQAKHQPAMTDAEIIATLKTALTGQPQKVAKLVGIHLGDQLGILGETRINEALLALASQPDVRVDGDPLNWRYCEMAVNIAEGR